MRFLKLITAAAYFWAHAADLYGVEARFWDDRRRLLRRPDAAPVALPPAGALPAGATPGGLGVLLGGDGFLRGEGRASGRAPFVVLLQDVHEVEEAQRRIAGMIASLSSAGRIGLVGLEGAEGPLDLTPYRDWPDAEVSWGVADHLLRRGYIGGAEFLGMTAAAPPPMTGVEDGGLYGENVRALRASLAARPAVQAALARGRAALDRLKPLHFSPALAEVDRLFRAHRAGAGETAEYARALARACPAALAEAPQVRALLGALARESALDFGAAEAERRRLIDALSRRLPAPEMDALARRSLAYREGRLGHAAYHEGLKALCRARGVPFGPALDAYVDYTRAADALDREALAVQLPAVGRAARRLLAGTPAQRRLLDADDALALLERLAALAMAPEDWAEYAAAKPDLPRRLEDAAALAGAPAAPPLEDMAPFEDFCRLALARNAALVDHLLSAMAARGVAGAALVAGGFHTEGLKALLDERGVSWAVAAPRLEVPAGLDPAGGFARAPLPLERLFAGREISLVFERLTDGPTAPEAADRRRAMDASVAALNALGSADAEDLSRKAESLPGVETVEIDALPGRGEARLAVDGAFLAAERLPPDAFPSSVPGSDVVESGLLFRRDGTPLFAFAIRRAAAGVETVRGWARSWYDRWFGKKGEALRLAQRAAGTGLNEGLRERNLRRLGEMPPAAVDEAARAVLRSFVRSSYRGPLREDAPAGDEMESLRRQERRLLPHAVAALGKLRDEASAPDLLALSREMDLPALKDGVFTALEEMEAPGELRAAAAIEALRAGAADLVGKARTIARFAAPAEIRAAVESLMPAGEDADDFLDALKTGRGFDPAFPAALAALLPALSAPDRATLGRRTAALLDALPGLVATSEREFKEWEGSFGKFYLHRGLRAYVRWDYRVTGENKETLQVNPERADRLEKVARLRRYAREMETLRGVLDPAPAPVGLMGWFWGCAFDRLLLWAGASPGRRWAPPLFVLVVGVVEEGFFRRWIEWGLSLMGLEAAVALYAVIFATVFHAEGVRFGGDGRLRPSGWSDLAGPGRRFLLGGALFLGLMGIGLRALGVDPEAVHVTLGVFHGAYNVWAFHRGGPLGMSTKTGRKDEVVMILDEAEDLGTFAAVIAAVRRAETLLAGEPRTLLELLIPFSFRAPTPKMTEWVVQRVEAIYRRSAFRLNPSEVFEDLRRVAGRLEDRGFSSSADAVNAALRRMALAPEADIDAYEAVVDERGEAELASLREALVDVHTSARVWDKVLNHLIRAHARHPDWPRAGTLEALKAAHDRHRRRSDRRRRERLIEALQDWERAASPVLRRDVRLEALSAQDHALVIALAAALGGDAVRGADLFQEAFGRPPTAEEAGLFFNAFETRTGGVGPENRYHRAGESLVAALSARDVHWAGKFIAAENAFVRSEAREGKLKALALLAAEGGRPPSLAQVRTFDQLVGYIKDAEISEVIRSVVLSSLDGYRRGEVPAKTFAGLHDVPPLRGLAFKVRALARVDKPALGLLLAFSAALWPGTLHAQAARATERPDGAALGWWLAGLALLFSWSWLALLWEGLRFRLLSWGRAEEAATPRPRRLSPFIEAPRLLSRLLLGGPAGPRWVDVNELDLSAAAVATRARERVHAAAQARRRMAALFPGGLTPLPDPAAVDAVPLPVLHAVLSRPDEVLRAAGGAREGAARLFALLAAFHRRGGVYLDKADLRGEAAALGVRFSEAPHEKPSADLRFFAVLLAALVEEGPAPLEAGEAVSLAAEAYNDAMGFVSARARIDEAVAKGRPVAVELSMTLLEDGGTMPADQAADHALRYLAVLAEAGEFSREVTVLLPGEAGDAALDGFLARNKRLAPLAGRLRAVKKKDLAVRGTRLLSVEKLLSLMGGGRPEAAEVFILNPAEWRVEESVKALADILALVIGDLSWRVPEIQRDVEVLNHVKVMA